MIDYRIGDTRDLTAELAGGSVSLVTCSPPFLALRSYLPADHEHKHAEIGSEPDPATFLDTLLALTAEWGRVLAPWGSIAIELGDTYAGSGGAGGDYNADGLREGQQKFSGSAAKRAALGHGDNDRPSRAGRTGEWPRPKCLALIPQAYAMSLAYGRNIITGQPSPAGQWLVRNVIVWHRPNPAVGALGDKFRPCTSYITVATRSPKRWFDLTAVRQPYKVPDHPQVGKPTSYRAGQSGEGYGDEGRGVGRVRTQDPAGAPPLDCWFDEHDTWTVTTQPSKLAHYAMWPPKLAERLILSMCPQWVCSTCGEPRRRIERIERLSAAGKPNDWDAHSKTGGPWTSGLATRPETLGWTDCGCGEGCYDELMGTFVPGVVLDPFAGTGTTLAVAECHGRDSIGFDLDPRNRDLLAPRMDEVRRSLFGTTPEIPGQLDIFAEVNP